MQQGAAERPRGADLMKQKPERKRAVDKRALFGGMPTPSRFRRATPSNSLFTWINTVCTDSGCPHLRTCYYS